MAKIEVGRFSELMRRYLSMAGVVEVTQELAPEISTVFTLEAERPEWEFLKGGKLCTSQFSITGVAAQQAKARIRNPAGSGVIAIFTDYQWALDGNGLVLLFRVETTADLGVVVATMTRDTRWPSPNVSALVASQETSVGVSTGDFFWQGRTLNETPSPPNHIPFVLTPGFAIELNVQSLALGVRGTMHYLERPIGTMERG